MFLFWSCVNCAQSCRPLWTKRFIFYCLFFKSFQRFAGMRATWKKREAVCWRARLIYWPVCIKMTGRRTSVKPRESGDEKYHLCEGCVFVLTYFHPLTERRRWQRRHTLNLWWHDVTPDDAKISSETAFFFPSTGLHLSIISGLKQATLHRLAGQELTFMRCLHSAFLFSLSLSSGKKKKRV